MINQAQPTKLRYTIELSIVYDPIQITYEFSPLPDMMDSFANNSRSFHEDEHLNSMKKVIFSTTCFHGEKGLIKVKYKARYHPSV